jgi:transposase-like protein
MVPKRIRRVTEFDDMVIGLYAKGLTTRDTAEWLEQTHGAKISRRKRVLGSFTKVLRRRSRTCTAATSIVCSRPVPSIIHMPHHISPTST